MIFPQIHRKYFQSLDFFEIQHPKKNRWKRAHRREQKKTNMSVRHKKKSFQILILQKTYIFLNENCKKSNPKKNYPKFRWVFTTIFIHTFSLFLWFGIFRTFTTFNFFSCISNSFFSVEITLKCSPQKFQKKAIFIDFSSQQIPFTCINLTEHTKLNRQNKIPISSPI